MLTCPVFAMLEMSFVARFLIDTEELRTVRTHKVLVLVHIIIMVPASRFNQSMLKIIFTRTRIIRVASMAIIFVFKQKAFRKMYMKFITETLKFLVKQ